MDRDLARVVANIIAYVAVVAVNAAASIVRFNGQTTADVSNRFPTLVTPAGYAFIIWGIIYIFLAGFIVYQALPAQRRNPRLQRIGWLFVLSSAANIAWIFLWSYNIFAATLVAIFILLGSLISIYLLFDIGLVRLPFIEQWLINAPFSIYLAWITVASIANVAVALTAFGWNGFGLAPVVWAVALVTIATGIAAAVAWTRVDLAYVAVIVWSLTAIAVRQAGVREVVLAAWAGSAAVVVVLIIAAVRRGWVSA
ncbi:MAG TPA: tryptophan-rich sensory protein [Anaerolineae bacterium]|nr:tryptophan-rich sensory protein [Anaerolineae bacterium]HOQ99046.1 tryptophan-rich sensory protein [Anaerolineae bacterium]HPL28928.1 tryptophan-rich sensory protein [Anaerolineae bacterium]